MRFILPRDQKNILWTSHVKGKMIYYQLSDRKVRGVLRNTQRIERGIAPNTLAVMQRAGTKKYPTEIWVMYQKISQKRKVKDKPERIRIISTWRYPGISPEREPPSIPEDALAELQRVIKNT